MTGIFTSGLTARTQTQGLDTAGQSGRSQDLDHMISDRSQDWNHGIFNRSQDCDHMISDRSQDCDHMISDRSQDCEHMISDRSQDCYQGMSDMCQYVIKRYIAWHIYRVDVGGCAMVKQLGELGPR